MSETLDTLYTIQPCTYWRIFEGITTLNQNSFIWGDKISLNPYIFIGFSLTVGIIVRARFALESDDLAGGVHDGGVGGYWTSDGVGGVVHVDDNHLGVANTNHKIKYQKSTRLTFSS